jgi:hypothetical protein
MKEWINKKVIIVVERNSVELTYTAIVTEVTDMHISFTDKFNNQFTYKISDVSSINEGNSQ